MAHDKSWFELAELFLKDDLVLVNEPRLVWELAEHIQLEIEGWMEHERERIDRSKGRLDKDTGPEETGE